MANIYYGGTTSGVTIVGSDTEDDVFVAQGAGDIFFGMGGNDVFNGNSGGAPLTYAYGGLGDDTYVQIYSAGSYGMVITEFEGEGTDTLISNTTISGAIFETYELENFMLLELAINGNIVANELANTLTGNYYTNTLDGLAGNDIIFGRHGADTLNGGENNDVLVGGRGADALNGGNGIDTASYVDAIAAVVVNLTAPVSNTGDAFGDTYSSIEYLTGSRFADTLTGANDANRIDGGLGDDIIIGGGGIDTMIGREGSDTFSANVFNDIAIEELATGGGTDRVVWLGVTGTLTLGNNIENMVMQGASAIGGTGNALANAMSGNAASNILTGKAGNDVLTGGGGVDFFVLDTAVGATNVDTMTDFGVDDFIRLSKTTFAAVGPSFTSNEFVANTTGAAGDADDRIVYETDTGKLFYDINGNVAGGSTLVAVLTQKPAIGFADFQFV